MDAKVALFLNATFIFAMLLTTSGDDQYPNIPYNAAPSPRFNLKSCQDKPTTVCRGNLFSYIF